MRQVFSIKDKDNRTWGTFQVARSEHGEVHGYLKTEQDFEQVRELFLEHERAFSNPDSDTELTGKKIVELGAYLVDSSSGERIDISNIIFINEDLLVSCELRIDGASFD